MKIKDVIRTILFLNQQAAMQRPVLSQAKVEAVTPHQIESRMDLAEYVGLELGKKAKALIAQIESEGREPTDDELKFISDVDYHLKNFAEAQDQLNAALQQMN